MQMRAFGPARRALAVFLAASTALSPVVSCAASTGTASPIQHVVVLYQENASFDHYFGTYPYAANNSAETTFTGIAAPSFMAKSNTPGVNGLTQNLLTNNPNKDSTGAQANPFRLLPSQSYTCSWNHNYGGEQLDIDSGLADNFPAQNLNKGEGCAPAGGTVMAYFDGNEVNAYWNYAQHYAMSDNFYGTDFGPSSPGAINLISGNTSGGEMPFALSSGDTYTPNAGTAGSGTVADSTAINDSDAYLDDCGGDKGGTVTTAATLLLTGKNIGDLLNAKGVTWGWFQGGFAATTAATLNGDGSTKTPAACTSAHTTHQVTLPTSYISFPNSGLYAGTYTVQQPTITPGAAIQANGTDYVSHHEPFMFYASTRNPHHLPPTGAIGSTDQANHQYDASNFFQALSQGYLPSVSFIKAPYYSNGHPGNSDPLTEQAWIVQTVDAIQASPLWSTTAIIIAYDDSDGWYDHVVPTNVRKSNITTSGNTNASDGLTGAGSCGTPGAGLTLGRCGFGPRLPLIVISPYAKTNYVDHTMTDQSSITALIEANWNLGYIDGPTAPAYQSGSTDRYAGSLVELFDFADAPNTRQLQLNPVTGVVVGKNW